MWMPVWLALLLPAETPATNWPGFRGDGSSTSRAELPCRATVNPRRSSGPAIPPNSLPAEPAKQPHQH